MPFDDPADAPYRGPLPSFPPRVRFGAIGEGWEFFKQRMGTWLLAGLIVVLGNWAVFGAVHAIIGTNFPPAGGGFRVQVPPPGPLLDALLAGVLNGFLLGGMFRMACLQVRGQPISVNHLFQVTDVLPELVIGSALYGLGCFLAASFCLLPAFVLAGVWMFTIPLIVDARLHAIDAIGQSWRALKREWLTATVFQLTTNLIAGLGACFCCGGLLFTMPLYCLSIAVLYRDFFLSDVPTDPVKPHPVDPYF
ncbi:MAG: hypothetical protein NVSMB9_05620 [Isosphaeraceae bacterium]